MSAATVALTTVVVASDEQVSAELTGETVLLSLRDAQYYGLDGVGHRIWRLAQSPVSVGDIVDQVLREYEVDRATAERDLIALVGQLLDQGLLQRAPASDSPSAG